MIYGDKLGGDERVDVSPDLSSRGTGPVGVELDSPNIASKVEGTMLVHTDVKITSSITCCT